MGAGCALNWHSLDCVAAWLVPPHSHDRNNNTIVYFYTLAARERADSLYAQRRHVALRMRFETRQRQRRCQIEYAVITQATTTTAGL